MLANGIFPASNIQCMMIGWVKILSHRSNRIQANLEYPCISLGAKTDLPNLGFHI